tara:strand:- start:2399 stop:2596 length:198 start_codon:yes stop_codon:yes gene_type:complete
MKKIGQSFKKHIALTVNKEEAGIINNFFESNPAYTMSGFVKMSVLDSIKKLSEPHNQYDNVELAD